MVGAGFLKNCWKLVYSTFVAFMVQSDFSLNLQNIDIPNKTLVNKIQIYDMKNGLDGVIVGTLSKAKTLGNVVKIFPKLSIFTYKVSR